MTKETIEVSLDKETKQQADKVFKTLGLTDQDAICMFYRQVVLHDGIPFPLFTEKRPPMPPKGEQPVTVTVSKTVTKTSFSDEDPDEEDDFFNDDVIEEGDEETLRREFDKFFAIYFGED